MKWDAAKSRAMYLIHAWRKHTLYSRLNVRAAQDRRKFVDKPQIVAERGRRRTVVKIENDDVAKGKKRVNILSDLAQPNLLLCPLNHHPYDSLK